MKQAIPNVQEQWAPGLRAGDREVFRQLVGELWGTVTRIANQCLGDWSAAQDVAQRTFLRVWENRETVEGANGRVARFCICIARRMAIDELRRQSRAPQNTADPETGHPGVSSSSPDDQALAGELWDQVDRLPENERDVVILRFACGWTLAEVAGRTGLPQGTVSTLQRRALGRLRARYGVTATILISLFGAGATSASAAPATTIPAIGNVIPAQTVAASSGTSAAVSGASTGVATAAATATVTAVSTGSAVLATIGSLLAITFGVWLGTIGTGRETRKAPPVTEQPADLAPRPMASNPNADNPSQTEPDDEASTGPAIPPPFSTSRAVNEFAVDRHDLTGETGNGQPAYDGMGTRGASGWPRYSSSSETGEGFTESDRTGLDAPFRSGSDRTEREAHDDRD